MSGKVKCAIINAKSSVSRCDARPHIEHILHHFAAARAHAVALWSRSLIGKDDRKIIRGHEKLVPIQADDVVYFA